MNAFKNLFAVLGRETQRIAHDKVTLFISFVAPIFGIVMIWWIFSAGVIRDLPIAVVNQDHSNLSYKLTNMIEATAVAEIYSQPTDMESAQKLMKQGKVIGIVLIPNNFERDVVKGAAPTLTSYINNVNVVSGGLLKAAIQKVTSTLSTGIKMQIQMKKGYTQQEALARVMPIHFDNHLLFNPFTNYSYFLALGTIPIIIVIVCFLGTIYAFGSEIKDGTSKKLMETAGGNIYTAVIGKLLPHTLIYLLCIRLATVVLINKLGLPMHGNIWIIIGAELALILAYQSIALLFIAITSNMRLSLSLGSAYTMMALTFSGLTFPMIAMPKIVQLIANLFPYTFWLRIFMGETLRSIPNTQIILQFTSLFLFTLLGTLCFRKLEKIFTDETYWGKA